MNEDTNVDIRTNCCREPDVWSVQPHPEDAIVLIHQDPQRHLHPGRERLKLRNQRLKARDESIGGIEACLVCANPLNDSP